MRVLGLKVDRLNLLRRAVGVDQQLLTSVGRPLHLSPPKTAASVRTIPLPQIVVDVLAAHLAAYPAGIDGFVFILDGAPIGRQKFGHLWRPMIQTVGLPKGTGFQLESLGYHVTLDRAGQPRCRHRESESSRVRTCGAGEPTRRPDSVHRSSASLLNWPFIER